MQRSEEAISYFLIILGLHVYGRSKAGSDLIGD